MYEGLFDSCRSAAEELYLLIKEGLDEDFFLYEGVGAGGDRSSKIDLHAEKIYISRLSKFGMISSEESGEIGEGDLKIVLDPIDGSDNLVSGFPYFGSSVAVRREGKTIFSFIVNLANGDFFVKWEGFFKRGSLFEDEFYDVARTPAGKIGLFEKAYANPVAVSKLQKSSIKFRSPGAVALSLGYAHYVDFVLFMGDIREYDVAAGLHQCEGLNCLVTKEALLVSKNRKLFDIIKGTIFKG